MKGLITMSFRAATNEGAFFMRTNRANLSKAMQWLGVSYTRRFNNRHSRSGHLRLRSSLLLAVSLWNADRTL